MRKSVISAYTPTLVRCHFFTKNTQKKPSSPSQYYCNELIEVILPSVILANV